MRFVVLAAVAAFAVTACEERATYYRRDGAVPGDGQFERDKARCFNEGYAIGGYGRPASVGEVAHNCLIASGWRVAR